MGKPCRVTFGDHVFFKDDFIHRMLDTLHLDDAVVDSSPYLKSIEYDNSFREGDPMLIREKKAEAKVEERQKLRTKPNLLSESEVNESMSIGVASGGYTPIKGNRFDFRPVNDNITAKEIENFEDVRKKWNKSNSPFVFISKKGGKRYMVAVAGLNNYSANSEGGREGSVYVSVEITDSLPSNSEELLLKKAIEEYNKRFKEQRENKDRQGRVYPTHAFKNEYISDLLNTQTTKSTETTPQAAEAAPVAEEQYQPITIKDITHDRFSKDNAMDYEEDEKESDSGRVSTYISSMTIETTDGEGNTNGALVKLTDEDGIVSWNAEDMDGNELSYDGFDTKDEAKQAIADAWNKEKKKEFDKEAKKAAKKKQKAQAAAPQPTAAAPKAPSIDNVAQNAGISPKNIRDLYKVNRELFSLNQVKALVSAVAMDRMIGVMAKRAGVTKAEMYGRLKFEKASEQDLPQGVKMQVDAWHGSPYEFDKFQTEFMGKGEGAQAFGWGLYFTDIKGIAEGYARALTKQLPSFNGKTLNILSIEKKFGKNNISSRTLDLLQRALSSVSGVASKQDLIKYVNENSFDFDKENKEALSLIEGYNDGQNLRQVYKVSLHKGKSPEQYDWFIWDKKLSDSQIDKILNQLKKEGLLDKYDDYSLLIKRAKANGRGAISLERARAYTFKEGNHTFGDQAYSFLSNKIFNSPKDASLFLLRAGIDGIKYPAESLSRGATSETARGFNYVVFDENAVSIEEVVKFQKDAGKARGAMMITLDGQATIYALTDPNVSTPLHELAHVFEHYLTDGEKKVVMDAAKTKEWNIETSEYFARGFEKYLAEGKSPIAALDKIFAKFKEWLTDIYNGISGSDIDIELNDKMRKIYAQMLGKEIVNKAASKKAPSIFTDLDATNKRGGLKAQQEAKKSFKEKYGNAADVAKAISANFEAIADELKSKDVFTEIDCK